VKAVRIASDPFPKRARTFEEEMQELTAQKLAADHKDNELLNDAGLMPRKVADVVEELRYPSGALYRALRDPKRFQYGLSAPQHKLVMAWVFFERSDPKAPKICQQERTAIKQILLDTSIRPVERIKCLNAFILTHDMVATFKRFKIAEDAFHACGSWGGLDYICVLQLSSKSLSWEWSVEIKNLHHSSVELDLIYVQDAGMKPMNAGLINEYYVSQYLERRILEDKIFGAVACFFAHLLNPVARFGSGLADRGRATRRRRALVPGSTRVLLVRGMPGPGRPAGPDRPPRTSPSESRRVRRTAHQSTNPPKNPTVEVQLVSNPDIKTAGKVRYVSPQADPTTRTFTVRVSLPDAPSQMRLGANVVGSVTVNEGKVVAIPGSALFQKDGKPAVWLVTKDGTVQLKPITVERYQGDSVVVAGGLAQGDVVVTGGAQKLLPGQKVRMMQASAG